MPPQKGTRKGRPNKYFHFFQTLLSHPTVLPISCANEQSWRIPEKGDRKDRYY
jgi:hypothetical protein